MSYASVRAWKRANPAATREQLQRRRLKIRAECMAAYGGKCVSCCETNIDLMELDHENGQGNAHRDEIFGLGHNSPGGWNFYSWLRRAGWPQDLGLVIRCKDCHDVKHNRTEKEPSGTPPPRERYAVSGTDEDQVW